MSGQADDATITLAGHRDERAATRLLLSHRHGVELVDLAARPEVVIGRARPADVVIDEPSLSRSHARVALAEGVVRVCDLGAKNGVEKNGVRCEQTTLERGDVIRLGEVSLLLLGGSARDLEVVDHRRFVEGVERQLVRARFSDGELALLLVAGDEPVARWLPGLATPQTTAVAAYAAQTAEVLLAGQGAEPARQWAATLPPGCRVGISVFPTHGATAEDLLAAASEALFRAAPGERIKLAEVSPLPAQLVTSEATREVYQTARKVARSSLPVLIGGETGVGKEVLARAIHEMSPRKDGPFVALNCGALPPTLVDSQLFGHERGAFTGAERRHVGAFAQADGGTLFLDEVGELIPDVQVTLLRVLEDGQVTPLGASVAKALDVRVLAATNRDLSEQIEAGHFRADLYYRLDVVSLAVPPLRERVAEIVPLAERFLAAARERHGASPSSISAAAKARLEGHGWPGNVRELRNVIERAAVLATADEIDIADLPPSVRECDVSDPAPESTFRARLERYEAELIAEALRAARYNQSEAARRLHMPLRTMVRKIKSYGLGRARRQG